MKIRGFVLGIICLQLLLGGCGRTENIQKQTYPIIQLMTMGTAPENGMDEIYDKLDELTEKDLGVDVRISFYPWGDEADTMNKLVNSSAFDIYVYGASFESDVLSKKQAFCDMKDYLDEVPELVSFYEEAGVDLYNQEHLYSLPSLKEDSSYGFFYREDLREAWGLEEITDFKSVEAYLYCAKEAYPEIAPINDSRFFISLMQLMYGSKYYFLSSGLAIEWNQPDKIVCLLETTEYYHAVEVAQKWYQDGIISEDILYLQTNNTMSTLDMIKKDKACLEFCNHLSAICSNYVEPLYEINKEWQFGWLDYNIMNGTCYSNYIVNDGTIGLAIGSNCQYPKEAMLLLEKMHTDQTYYNLLTYGVEGSNYRLNEDGAVYYDGVASNNIIRGQIGLECDSLMLEHQYSGSWNEVYMEHERQYEQLKEYNGANIVTNFQLCNTDYENYQKVIDSYADSKIRQMIENGVVDHIDDSIEELEAELTDIGYQEFMQAVQEKLNQFYANNE